MIEDISRELEKLREMAHALMLLLQSNNIAQQNLRLEIIYKEKDKIYIRHSTYIQN